VSVFEQIALGWACVSATLRRMFQPVLWTPWLLLGAVHLVALLMLAGFAHPAVSAVMAPLVTALAGAGVRHYPEVFRQLPELQAQTGFVVDALLGPIAAGAAVAMLAAAFERGRATAGDALVHALERAGALIAALLPYAVIVFAITFGLQAWLVERGSAGMTRKLAQLVGLGGTVFLRAAVLYIVPLVVLGRLKPLDAWRELPSMLERGSVTALTIVLLVSLVAAPFGMLARFAPHLVDAGTPEAVVVLVAAQIAGGLITAFLLAGASVLAWQSVEIEVESGW